MVSSTVIKKGKQKFSEEVAKIKNLEVLGIGSCDITWEALIRKHLAFDALKCGTSSCDGDSCFKNEISNDCNC